MHEASHFGPPEYTIIHYYLLVFRMSIKYKVECCKDYYNYDCGTYCVAKNNPDSGYYTCDPLTGKMLSPPQG